MTCRWDRDREEYLADGEPCRTDDYGDPTRHCQSRRTCSEHVGWGELTCARCMGRTRADIRVIRDRAREALPVALRVGVNSEAANLAGPAADVAVFEARRAIARGWIYTNISQSARDWCEEVDCRRRHFKTAEGNRWHKRGLENAIADLIAEDDEFHPYSVLTRWEFMLREDYDQPRSTPSSITAAAEYLEGLLPRLAQDEGQDWPLFAREIRRCKGHLLSVIQDSTTPEHGAPCPRCKQPGPKLVRDYAHWCEDEDCEQIHYSVLTDPETGIEYPDTGGDHWVCPRDKGHVWSEHDYRHWVADVYAEEVGA